MKKLKISLTKKGLKILQRKRENEKLSKRVRDRIEILLQCHRGKAEKETADFLDITADTIWRTKKRYIEGGIKNALEEKERTGQPKKYNINHETELVATACSDAPEGRARWTIELLRKYMSKQIKGCENINRETIRLMLKGNECKPWIKKNVVYIGKINEEYRDRMYNLLELYAKGYDSNEPVVCMDEKSKQLLKESRPIIKGKITKIDYEYKRNGTRNIFLAVEPKGGKRWVEATKHRKRADFADFIKYLVDNIYHKAKIIHVVLDNLNTHFEKSLYERFLKKEAKRILSKIKFHYTPKHASWLNMAEIEIGIMDKQCLNKRIANEHILKQGLKAWQAQRNQERKRIEWKFTKQAADQKLQKYYI